MKGDVPGEAGVDARGEEALIRLVVDHDLDGGGGGRGRGREGGDVRECTETWGT